MSAVPGGLPKADLTSADINVSPYDAVTSLIVTLLIILGFGVAFLFLVWLAQVIVFRSRAVPVELVENVAGRGDHAAGFARDAEAPGMEEMPELAEPEVEMSMEALTDAISTVAASTESISIMGSTTSKGDGGLGDDRPPGPLGEGDNIIPRWERWEIRFESTSRNAYAAQLDFFKIELGAAGGKKAVDYAFNLTKAKPDTRSGPSDKEDRLYMTWRGGTLQRFDRELLANAGIPTADRILMQFYPKDLETELATLEKENGGNKTAQEYLKTVFEVRKKGSNGFEFFVKEQRFRPKPLSR